MTLSDRRVSYRAAPPTNPFIFTKKAVFMQRIGDAVRAGARHYVAGDIRLEKVPHLSAKFAARYAMNLPRMQDMRARKAGQDTARFLAWWDESSQRVRWVLFYFPGGKVICAQEKWKNPFEDRIRLTGYELVRITKRGAKAPVLTWRYTREQYRSLHDQIVFAVRGRQDAVLEQLIYTLSKSPGFAGVREQVKGLWAILKAEWKLRRSKSEPAPQIPPTIAYVRRLPDVGAVWSELLNKVKKGSADEQKQKPVEASSRKARSDSILVPAEAGGQAEKDRG